MRKLALTILVLLMVGSGFVLAGCGLRTTSTGFNIDKNLRNSPETKTTIKDGIEWYAGIPRRVLIHPFDGLISDSNLAVDHFSNGLSELGFEVIHEEDLSELDTALANNLKNIGIEGEFSGKVKLWSSGLLFGTDFEVKFVDIESQKVIWKGVAHDPRLVAEPSLREDRVFYPSDEALRILSQDLYAREKTIIARPVVPLNQMKKQIQEQAKLSLRPSVQLTEINKQQQTQIPQKQVAILKAGTGVMLGEAGYILTSYHLVRGMKEIRVKFINGEEIDAPLFIKDVVNDIAFLKLKQSPNISLMNIAMGDSSQMQIGDDVFTIGYPLSNILGQKPKYSEGVINSLSGIKDNLGFFQVSVPIQSGNSGGPLFNQRGELVAMVSSSLDPENTFRVLGTMPQNVNFAVKSSLVKNMIPMLPETLAAPTGIVVVPTDTDSLQSFIKRVQNNIVLIEAKE